MFGHFTELPAAGARRSGGAGGAGGARGRWTRRRGRRRVRRGVGRNATAQNQGARDGQGRRGFVDCSHVAHLPPRSDPLWS